MSDRGDDWSGGIADLGPRDAPRASGGQGGSAARALRNIEQLGSALGARRNDDVAYYMEVAGSDARWAVTHVSINERLNSVGSCTIEALCSEFVSPQELMHKDCSLSIDREAQHRSFKGIVWDVRVRESVRGLSVTLRVAPAAGLLGHKVDTHIHQDLTAPAIIEKVYKDFLGGLSREIKVDQLQRTYETREFTVQYQETSLAFISRLAEEEGIFWYFDHEGDHEVVVLADSTKGLPRSREDSQGQVQYHGDAGQLSDGEAAFAIGHAERIGATDAVVTDYDWTQPPLDVRGDATGRSQQAPALEIYDHTESLLFHDFGGGKYAGNTAKIQAQLRAERLDLDRQSWDMRTSVVTAMPGHVLELVGAPENQLDQRYLIVSVSGRGSATEGARGSWENTLEVVPAAMPYRPRRSTPRPVIPGPETARVVGPAGSEIHTDEHGRVRVHFHWDRYHEAKAEDSSCWMRVAHNWAGAGFGTFYLPRVGMEVVVSFLGGNPDRPLITGCVYNGDNRVNVELDAKKTQTLIRTKSSPNSDGFNELRFEDEAGKEFIFTHAEKDYNEVVEHNHSTRVKNCQTNTVNVDQTETIGHDQTLHVKNDRDKTVDNDEWVEIGHYRSEIVHGNEDWVVEGQRARTTTADDLHTVLEGRRVVTVETGKDVETYKGGRETTVLSFDMLDVTGHRNTQVSGQYNIKSGDHFKVVQNSINELSIKDSMYAAMVGRIQLKAGDGAVHYDAMPDGTATIKADTKLLLTVGASSIEITGSKITIKSPTVEINGTSLVDITSGGLVKLKS